jgi:ATP-dependent DNA helicase RecQ
MLSPICFPQNPYHRLVKDYKLVRESVNDPVADAALCGVLFRDEYSVLENMSESEPVIFSLLHFLQAEPEQVDDEGCVTPK